MRRIAVEKKPVVIPYEEYHRLSMEAGDVDPSYAMLRYVCDRFELNTEQRYWLAFLYATCYCGATVFYIYNEFPDFENVNEGRLESWWKSNRDKLVFQTDRARIRSSNQFCDVFRSYKAKVGRLRQEQLFFQFKSPMGVYNTYVNAWREMIDLYQFGRFSMFLYLEAVQVVTGFPMKPFSMDMAEAESCRNGLAYALDREDLITDGKPLKHSDLVYLQTQFDELTAKLSRIDSRNNVWNIETTLCAYKKYRLGSRYVGYYLDRQAAEIEKMEMKVKTGVDWSVLWQYRKETYDPKFLKETR